MANDWGSLLGNVIGLGIVASVADEMFSKRRRTRKVKYSTGFW